LAPAVLFGAVAWLPDPPDLARFLAFYAAFGQFLFAVLMLASGALTLSRLVVPLRRLKPIVDAPEEGGAERRPIPEPFAGLAAEGLRFRYAEDAPWAVDGIDLSVGPGETVALTGVSGSGKSTLLKLLLALEMPDEGRVLLAGRPLAEHDTALWRRSTGVVMQASPLFPGTLADNIAGPGAEAQPGPAGVDRAVAASARLVGLDPGMLARRVDPRRGLPGAMHQQVVLARALMRRPQLLLLDEATNVMDSDVLRLVMGSLRGLGIASLHITHRLTTLAMADRIHVLQAGRIVESGPFTELLGRNGAFVTLFRGQLGTGRDG
jgi:ATP-binding cassette subfamily C protein